MTAIKTILLPIDFSPHSRQALELARSLARDNHARLILLHVVPHVPPVDLSLETPELRKAEWMEEELKGYRTEMERMLARVPVPDPGVRVERLLKEGEIGAVVLHTAEETSCDLIVMGTHGRTGPGLKVLGSVTQAVLCKAPCPVLSVTAPTVEEPRGETAARTGAATTS
jgi:universal stress protein A